MLWCNSSDLWIDTNAQVCEVVMRWAVPDYLLVLLSPHGAIYGCELSIIWNNLGQEALLLQRDRTMLRVCLQLATTVKCLGAVFLLASAFSVCTIKFCTVFFGILVDAICNKKDARSLVAVVFPIKRRFCFVLSKLSTTFNNRTIIDPKSIYWLKLATFVPVRELLSKDCHIVWHAKRESRGCTMTETFWRHVYLFWHNIRTCQRAGRRHYFCMSYRFWDIQRQRMAWHWNWSRVRLRHCKWRSVIDINYKTSYWSAIVSVAVCCTIFKLFDVE